MKKMLKLLIILFLLYFAAQEIYTMFNKGHSSKYIVGALKDIEVHEVFTGTGSASDGYFINVSYKDYYIPFKIFNTMRRQKNIVEDVYIYSGDIYTCAQLSIKGDFNATDIKCTYNDNFYFYSQIMGQDPKLDTLIGESNYNVKKFTSDSESDLKDSIYYFINNFPDKHNLALSAYKGIYLFGTKVTSKSRFVQLFYKDQYDKTLETLVSKYYVVANYNDTHEYLSLKLVNMSTGNTSEVKLIDPISFNSFIQGSVDNKLYIIDGNSKVQYEIDIKSEAINTIGGINSGAQVLGKNGWSTKNINEVIDGRIKFYDNTVVNLDNNASLTKRYGDETGVYLEYFKNGNQYDAYIVYSEDMQDKTYAFKCDDPSKVIFDDGIAYYTYEDEIRLFSDSMGIRTLIKYSELKYNDALNFFIY